MAVHSRSVASAFRRKILIAIAVCAAVFFRLTAFAKATAVVMAEATDEACERLASLKVANGAVVKAESVNATGAPAFCRVNLLLTPSTDSEIQVEVQLPLVNWNGKFDAVGNGAWSGSINQAAMRDALVRGYATASTDTGHQGNTAAFALGHPEKLIDFAYRSEHEMTVAAKAIVTAYYRKAPKLSYWTGCSAGGRQAMKEAQMFPGDFDGIVAGSPGLDWSARSAMAVRTVHALAASAKATAARPFTPDELRSLHAAALEACDASDGLKDELISDPAHCMANAGDARAREMYASVVDANTKREMPGLARGSELGWTELGWTASARATGQDHYRFIAFKDPSWTIEKFNPETDMFRLDEGEAAIANATDTNLEPFFQRQGKLIQYHGWSDPQISPFSSVAYYQRVVDRFGADKVNASYRLFMAPGMGHCGGGEGPNQFDALGALEKWVEQGQPPGTIVASHALGGRDLFRVDRTRPLCPYPQRAVYKGSGSIDDAASFRCVR